MKELNKKEVEFMTEHLEAGEDPFPIAIDIIPLQIKASQDNYKGGEEYG